MPESLPLHLHQFGEWEQGWGNHTRQCTVQYCHETQTQPHSYGGWTQSMGGCRRSCTTCSSPDEQPHTFGNWTTGYHLGGGWWTQSKTCSSCGYVEQGPNFQVPAPHF